MGQGGWINRVEQDVRHWPASRALRTMLHWFTCGGRGLGHILALANQKGGVGKTTTSVNLACYLAGHGHRILLIDLDPQGNATSTLGVEKRELASTTYNVLVDGASIASCIVPGVRVNLDLLGANDGLAGAEIELSDHASPQHRLAHALESARERYDVVVIDCPPSLGLLTVNGLTA